jgi:hypothetical protein
VGVRLYLLELVFTLKPMEVCPLLPKHRRLMIASPSLGAGLPTDQELRKDKELPVCVGTPGGEHLWQVYLDNFDELHAVPASEAQRVEGTPSLWQQRVREAYQTWDLPRNVKEK